MIIENQKDVTTAVLAELQRAPDARFKEIMSAFVRHLHDFVRETKLSEEEFQAAIGYVVALGKHSNESHNEAVLMAGSLGLSALICLINSGNHGTTETDHNMLGPFWRMHSPVTPNGGSIVRSPTPGPALFVDAFFRDAKGNPIVGAEVDVWHSSPEGFYENQDPVQADMNLRGKFLTDADGHISFRSVKPAGYPIPIDGPTGDLLRALGRQYASRSSTSRTTSSSTPTCSSASRASSSAITCATTTRKRRHPTSRGRGIRSSTRSSWRQAAPSCRGRRSPARRAASGRRFRTWRDMCGHCRA